MSSEERKKLEQYLLQTGLTIDLAILLCLFTGLRVGELCGLQWGDIDFENGTLSVKRTVQRVYRNGCSEVLIGSPKSRTSVRTIPVPSFLLTLLKKKKRQDFLYLITGKSKPAEPRTMQYRFQKILKLCGIRKVPFHLLRHTYATDCIAHGFDAKTLSELLGHADASITLNRYAFFYADEAGIYKAIAIDGIIFRRQKIVWKMQKVSETAWLFRLEWSMGGFYETKMLPFF